MMTMMMMMMTTTTTTMMMMMMTTTVNEVNNDKTKVPDEFNFHSVSPGSFTAELDE